MRSLAKTLPGRLLQAVKEWKYAPVEKALRPLAPARVRAYHAWQRRRSPAHSARVAEILAAHPNPRAVVLFAPGLDWERQLFQRPQQMALALAKRGALVLYAQLDPPASGERVKALAERLYLCALPMEQFSALESGFVYTLTWNRKYLLRLDRPRILYDYVDDLSAFAGDAPQMLRAHRALLGEAALVAATARQLYEEVLPERPDALLVPNGVDYEHFHGAAGGPVPEDLRALRGAGRPILGYYGAFASWFDYTLLSALAEQRPDLTFVLIGPAHDRGLEESGLAKRANVHWLGPKPYAELPAYLACFDAALLPFRVNAITQATSPLKLFEYFAGGKPVVSTPLREVLQYPEVLTGADAAEFSRQIDAALSMRGGPAFARRLQQIAQENTWEARAECILQALERFEPRQ